MLNIINAWNLLFKISPGFGSTATVFETHPKVEKWKLSQCKDWLREMGHLELIPQFESKKMTGKTLLTLDIASLDLGSVRKNSFLRALSILQEHKGKAPHPMQWTVLQVRRWMTELGYDYCAQIVCFITFDNTFRLAQEHIMEVCFTNLQKRN